MKVLTIAGNSIRQIYRDRTTLFFTIALPFVIILFIGLATAGLGEAREFTFGVVDEGSGRMGAELLTQLDETELLKVQSYTGAEEMRRDIRRGVIVAGLVIPSNYDEALRDGEESKVTFIADLARGFPAVIRTTVAAAAGEQGGRIQAAQFATEEVGGSFDENLSEATQVERTLKEVAVQTNTIGRRGTRFIMAGFEYTAPANFVLFIFITSVAGSAQLIEARRLGVTRRMVGTPTRARTIMAGQALGRFGVAGLQGLYILALGIFFFGVDFGDPLAAGLLVAAFVLVGTSFGMLCGTIFRTPEQAGTIAPVAGIAMGMLSGCMWPRFVMPDAMQKLGQLFPHSWAMDAWIKLIARGSGVGGIGRELLVLAAFSAALLPIAAWRLRRSIVSAGL